MQIKKHAGALFPAWSNAGAPGVLPMSGLTNTEKNALRIAGKRSIDYRETIDDRPVRPVDSLDDAVAKFRTPLDEKGLPPDQVIETICRDADGGLNQMASGNFYGYVLGGSHPVGVAADMLVSAWGQNAGSAFETPAITGMERAVCDWCLELLGLPAESGVGIVTGATIANTEGIMAARHALLRRRGWDVELQGLFGAPEIPVFIGDAAHSAPFAALRYAGFGADRLTRVGVDDQGRMDIAALSRALDASSAAPLVVLQAGQINTGAFDRFADIIPAVHERGGWVHIDGAFGLWLACVPELAARLQGHNDADSWAVDLHKWLNAPFDAGLVVVKDRAPLVAAMSARGSYLPELTDHWEPSDSTLELSRRARGVPSYAIFRHLGQSGVQDMVARHCALAKWVAEQLGAVDGVTILNDVMSNQVAIAFGQGAKGDVQTKQVLEIVQENGVVYPTHGEWQGREIMRVSVINYATYQAQADLLISQILAAWRVVQGN